MEEEIQELELISTIEIPKDGNEEELEGENVNE